MQNPFTLTFGKSPLELVERPVQTNEIIEAFTVDPINQQMFIITGVRGLGKTVMMTDISHRLGKKRRLGSNRIESCYRFVAGNVI